MRLLIVIPHYCGAMGEAPNGAAYGSQLAIAPRVFALSEMLIALKRHFGERRFAGPFTELTLPSDEGRKLDIVIVTVEGRNVLHLLDIDRQEYGTEFYEGDPMFMGFETQRIAAERAGDYDVVGMMEDDLIINDPAFMRKVCWFRQEFGPRASLQPHRVEISRAGQLAKTLIEPTLPWMVTPDFQHAGAARTLEGSFAGRPQSFALTTNPHSGCWFLTHDQVEAWAKEPYFYDRVPAWTGPLESAATRAYAMRHSVYRSTEPDPFFLEIEHYGTRYANEHGPGGLLFRDSPFSRLKDLDGPDQDAYRTNVLAAELAKAQGRYKELEGSLLSRAELLRRFVRLTLSKYRKS